MYVLRCLILILVSAYEVLRVRTQQTGSLLTLFWVNTIVSHFVRLTMELSVGGSGNIYIYRYLLCVVVELQFVTVYITMWILTDQIIAA